MTLLFGDVINGFLFFFLSCDLLLMVNLFLLSSFPELKILNLDGIKFRIL